MKDPLAERGTLGEDLPRLPEFAFSTASVEFVHADPLNRYLTPEIFKTCFRDAKASGWISEALSLIENRLPVPPSCEPFQLNSFYRLQRSNRSCCLSTITRDGKVTGPVIVVKGLEVFSPDFERFLQRLSRKPNLSLDLSQIDHFPIIERKAPGVLTLYEAIQEADIAMRIHARFKMSIDDLRFPLPIAVYGVGDIETERYLSIVRGLTTSYTNSVIESVCKGGLGVYVYLYPSVPLRVFNTEEKSLPESLADHLTFLKSTSDPELVMLRWCHNAARLFAMNMLPLTSLSSFTGNCFQENNAVLDGGFVDLDSCVEIQSCMSDGFVLDSIDASLYTLSATIFLYLSRSKLLIEQSRTAIHTIERFCFDRIAYELEADPERSALDPRISSYFFEKSSVKRVRSFLGALMARYDVQN